MSYNFYLKLFSVADLVYLEITKNSFLEWFFWLFSESLRLFDKKLCTKFIDKFMTFNFCLKTFSIRAIILLENVNNFFYW